VGPVRRGDLRVAGSDDGRDRAISRVYCGADRDGGSLILGRTGGMNYWGCSVDAWVRRRRWNGWLWWLMVARRRFRFRFASACRLDRVSVNGRCGFSRVLAGFVRLLPRGC